MTARKGTTPAKKAAKKAPAKKVSPRKAEADPNVAHVPKALWDRYVALRTAREQYAEAEADVRAQIETIAGEAERITVNGKQVVSWRHLKTNRFDSAAHKKERPECHAEYTVPKPERRFELSEPLRKAPADDDD